MLAGTGSGRVSILLLTFLAAALAFPPGFVVRLTVRNAASPEAGISPGSLVLLGIGGFRPPSPPATERLQVLFAPDRGEAVPAGSLTRLSDYSLQVVVPRTAPPGEATVRLLLDGEPCLSARATISAAAPSGSWQFSAPGGAGLAALQTAFLLPPSPARWTNRPGPAVIRRDREVEIRWDSAGYGPGDRMKVTLARPSGETLRGLVSYRISTVHEVAIE